MGSIGSLVGPALGFLGGSLIGGGGGGGGSSGGSVQQVTNLLPEQQDLIRQIIEQVSGAVGQPGRVPGAELGPVGPSGLQQQAFGLGQQLPGQLGFDPQQTARQFQPTADFARQGFQQETIPAIASAVGFGGGARSSGFQDILAREGRNLELGLAGQLGQQQFGAQQAAFGRQAQLPTQIANLGALQQSFPAAQRAFDLERFFAAEPARNPALGFLGPALGQTFDTAVFQGFRQPGLAESLLPAAGNVLGGFAGSKAGSQFLSGLFS